MRHLARFIVGAVGAGLLVLSAPAAFATQGAHFFSASASVSSSTGALLLTWDEAGVGQQLVNYSVDIVSQSAIYACFNNGGNHPQASNKVGPTGPSSTDLGSFSPTNGRVTVTNLAVTGTPLSATLTCPSGQTRRVVQVTYTLGNLTDTTNQVSIALNSPGCVSLDTKNFPC
jgi:hypothetical protein